MPISYFQIFNRKVIEKSFVEFYKHYEEVVNKHLWMTSKGMNDPFGEERGTFDYETLLKRLHSLKAKYKINEENCEDCSSESEEENP